MLSTYSYDKLNRLKQDQPYTIVNNASTITSKWSSSYSYDLDGNITNLMRDDGNGSGIDNLSYAYPASGGKTINNRLNHIVDQLAPNDNGKGMVTQNPGNYTYDATGNLTADVTEGITSITWTPYNKIRELVKTNATPATGTTTLRYLYDAAGNRVVKDYHATQNTTLTSRTWYIRDAQGTVLAIYTRKPTVGNSGSVTRTEAPIYGSSRIGQSTRTATYDASASGEATLLGTVYSRELGKRAYELVDHLGNVRATISDILVPRTATNTYDADVLTLTDYYPFGMQMDTRTWEASGVAGHRYGYNGQERDDEIKGSGNSYDFEFRIYDPRVVRFMSIDPLSKQYPMLTPYQFASNRPIDGVDIEGQEWKSQHKWSDKITDKAHIKLLGASYFNGMTYQQAWSVMAPTLLEAKEGDTYDCADLSITVLVEFAYMFRLPVHFQDSKKDNRDSEFDNDAYGYKGKNGKWTSFNDGDWKALASAIAGQYGAADLYSNRYLTEQISFGDLKAGDLVGWQYREGYYHSQTVATVGDSWWFDFDDVNDYYTTIQGSLSNGLGVPAYEKEYDVNSVKKDGNGSGATTRALQWNTKLFDKKK